MFIVWVGMLDFGWVVLFSLGSYLDACFVVCLLGVTFATGYCWFGFGCV